MDFRSLKSFITVAETLNFRIAADLLNITQPALSIRLKRLEEQLNIHLIERSRHQVKLSKEGEFFLPQAKRLLRETDHTLAAAKSISEGHSGELRIGYTPVSFFGQVPLIIRQFKDSYPEIHIKLFELLSNEIETELSDGKLDAGFLHPPLSENTLSYYDLNAEEFVIALPENHDLAKKNALSIADLSKEDFILVRREVGPALFDRILSLCHKAGFSPSITQEAETSISVVGLVSSGLGIGFVIESMSCYQHPGICYRKILGEPPSLPFALAWKGQHKTPMIKQLIQLSSR